MKKIGFIPVFLVLALASCTVQVTPRENLVKKALKYVGTPYKYGGESPSEGFDCSGFVYYVYKSIGYNIPRSTEEQLKAGRKVMRGFKKGDLLFFKFNGKLHVGIFIGNHHMLHSSPKKGVVVENLNRYWKKHFYRGVRIL